MNVFKSQSTNWCAWVILCKMPFYWIIAKWSVLEYFIPRLNWFDNLSNIFFIYGLRKINRKCFFFIYLASSFNVFYYNSVFYAITFGKTKIKSGQSLKVHYHVKATFSPYWFLLSVIYRQTIMHLESSSVYFRKVL